METRENISSAVGGFFESTYFMIFGKIVSILVSTHSSYIAPYSRTPLFSVFWSRTIKLNCLLRFFMVLSSPESKLKPNLSTISARYFNKARDALESSRLSWVPWRIRYEGLFLLAGFYILNGSSPGSSKPASCLSSSCKAQRYQSPFCEWSNQLQTGWTAHYPERSEIIFKRMTNKNGVFVKKSLELLLALPKS